MTSGPDSATLRTVLGHFPSGVVVVAATAEHGPVGLTCQSFVSLSLDPPLVSFCVARTSKTWPSIRAAGTFTVSVLAHDQEHYSIAFAQSGADKFAGVDWVRSPGGAPVIAGSCAWIDCTVHAIYDGGDHEIVVARVGALGADAHRMPLVVHHGLYGMHPAAAAASMGVHVVGVVASPTAGGRTATGVAGVLAGAAVAGATTTLTELPTTTVDSVISAVDSADAVVLGSPVYRATYSSQLKALLEVTERKKWGEQLRPLQGKAAAVLLTGASAHHFLAVDGLRSVLSGFFAVQVLSPGLYLEHADYDDELQLGKSATALTFQHGRALVELATAIRASEALRSLVPLV